MTTFWRPVNLTLDVFGIVLCLIPMIGVLARWRENPLNRYYAWITGLISLFLLSDATARFFDGRIEYGALVCMARAAYTALGFGVLAAFVWYAFALFGSGLKDARRGLQLILMLCAASMLWVVLCAFGDMLCVIDAYGYSQPGDLAFVFPLMAVICLLLLIGTVLVRWSDLDRRVAVSLLLSALLPIVAIAIQQFQSAIGLPTVAAVLSFLVLYVSMLEEQSRTLHEREIDLSQSSMELMLGQIQPHFLYNTLVAISQLCETAPIEASEMVAKFSQYLKVNVDSLRKVDPIPFAEELDHVMIYLFIEQKRFEERLRVELDIRATEFEVPPLSLQPIVENAVRHGVTRREEGGTIRIETTEQETCWRIVVRDDGVGYDTRERNWDRQKHVGIENVRTRLKIICDGALQIDSEPGKGTIVSITIPKKKPDR